jgi:epoxyqueuosine reductase
MDRDFLQKSDLNLKLVVHTCCADCLLNTINYLQKKNIVPSEQNIVCLYYNPNIHPRSEYLERLNAIKKILPKEIKLVVADYKPKEYIDAIGETNSKPERCKICWTLRLKFLFDYAKKNNIKIVTTTLLSSNYQNREEILRIGKELEKEYGIKFLEVDTGENCKHSGFYKQNYCGCCLSLMEKMVD